MQDGGEHHHNSNLIDAADYFAEWRHRLLKNKNGVKPCFANVVHALRHAPEWKGKLGWDTFGMRAMVRGAPPWMIGQRFKPRQWDDDDDGRAVEWLQHNGVMAKLHEVGPAAVLVARENAYDPLTDYLDDCVAKWVIETALAVPRD